MFSSRMASDENVSSIEDHKLERDLQRTIKEKKEGCRGKNVGAYVGVGKFIALCCA